MNNDTPDQVDADYWWIVEPIWNNVDIYSGPQRFLATFAAAPEGARDMLAVHWCMSEVCNGGFGQFFSNSTGVLAPEAAAGLVKIGMPQLAALVRQAMGIFEDVYPRERRVREEALSAFYDAREASGEDSEADDLLDRLDDAFYATMRVEAGGYEQAANRYASSFCNAKR